MTGYREDCGPSCYTCYPRPSGPCFTGTIPSGGRAQTATPSATPAATPVGRRQNTEHRIQSTEHRNKPRSQGAAEGRSTARKAEQCFAPTGGCGLGNGNLHAGSVKGAHVEGRHDAPLFQYSTEIANHQRVFGWNLKVLEQGNRGREKRKAQSVKAKAKRQKAIVKR